MWSFLLTAFNAVASPALLQEYKSDSVTKQSIDNGVPKSTPHIKPFEVAQNSNLIEAISPLGYSLKYPASWKPFSTPSSSINSDIFLIKGFTNPTGDIVVTITTTIMDSFVTPGELPPKVKKFDRATQLYAGIMAQTGYKIIDAKKIMINGKNAVRLVSQTPENNGSVTVILEGKDEKMVISTSNYPIDSSKISQRQIEEIISEINLIQNSITIR